MRAHYMARMTQTSTPMQNRGLKQPLKSVLMLTVQSTFKDVGNPSQSHRVQSSNCFEAHLCLSHFHGMLFWRSVPWLAGQHCHMNK